MCGLALIKLKVLARDLYSKLDENRKSLEIRKSAIDKLQLTYENVLYRKAYLKREIQTCKDLATPNIDDIEKETGSKLGTLEYNESLEDITEETMEFLNVEMENRKTLKRALDSLQEERQALQEKLEKKRKFLGEVPRKVASIKAAALDLKTFLE
ncbi:hypothetical protein EON65_15175 [archaeon]|nr:MAG: hypothetical protein EON65_15175 [archaeon]